MKSIQRISFIFVLILFTFVIKPVNSQELLWKAGNWGFFHNQEYFNDFIEPQTMGGTRVYGQIGLKPNENQEFFAGVDYLYEFGADPYDQTIAPIIYFHHENKLVDFYVGAFPRYNIIDMPTVLLSDTIHYYRPNIEGIYFNIRKPWGYHKAWLDWTSRQTNTRRETFSLGLTGRANFGIFYYRHDFIMYHFAGPMIRIPNDHIRDNGGATIGLGIDFSSKMSLDTLTLFVGYCGSYDQLRDVYDTRYNSGLISMLDVSYKFISLHNTLYFGDNQVHLLGDKFYTSDFYNRTDLRWNFFRSDRIKGELEFGFHLVPGVLDMHQRLSVRIDLSGGNAITLKN